MEVHFTPEQEAQLPEIASQASTDAEHLVKKVALSLLERDARFRSAVHKGLEQADRASLSRRVNGIAHCPDDSSLMRIRWTPTAADDLPRMICNTPLSS